MVEADTKEMYTAEEETIISLYKACLMLILVQIIRIHKNIANVVGIVVKLKKNALRNREINKGMKIIQTQRNEEVERTINAIH